MIDAILATIEDEEQRNELAEFYAEHKNRLYAIALSKLHNKTDAEDAVQEVFSRIADKPENFFEIPPHKRGTYADVIVRNISGDMYKKQKQENTVSVDTLGQELSEYISVEDIVIGNELYSELVGFIRKLPDARKSALILRIMYKMSTAEIAETLNISETAARKRLSDAGKLIKEFLRSRNDETTHS